MCKTRVNIYLSLKSKCEVKNLKKMINIGKKIINFTYPHNCDKK